MLCSVFVNMTLLTLLDQLGRGSEHRVTGAWSILSIHRIKIIMILKHHQQSYTHKCGIWENKEFVPQTYHWLPKYLMFTKSYPNLTQAESLSLDMLSLLTVLALWLWWSSARINENQFTGNVWLCLQLHRSCFGRKMYSWNVYIIM